MRKHITFDRPTDPIDERLIALASGQQSAISFPSADC